MVVKACSIVLLAKGTASLIREWIRVGGVSATVASLTIQRLRKGLVSLRGSVATRFLFTRWWMGNMIPRDREWELLALAG